MRSISFSIRNSGDFKKGSFEVLAQVLRLSVLLSLGLLSVALGQYDFLNEGQPQLLTTSAQTNGRLRWDAYSQIQQRVVPLMSMLRGRAD